MCTSWRKCSSAKAKRKATDCVPKMLRKTTARNVLTEPIDSLTLQGQYVNNSRIVRFFRWSSRLRAKVTIMGDLSISKSRSMVKLT